MSLFFLLILPFIFSFNNIIEFHSNMIPLCSLTINPLFKKYCRCLMDWHAGTNSGHTVKGTEELSGKQIPLRVLAPWPWKMSGSVPAPYFCICVHIVGNILLYLTKPFPSFKIYPPYKRVFSILLSCSYNTDVIQLAYQYINCNCPIHCCYCYCYSILWRWVIKASLHSRRQGINLYLLDGNIYIHICICM